MNEPRRDGVHQAYGIGEDGSIGAGTSALMPSNDQLAGSVSLVYLITFLVRTQEAAARILDDLVCLGRVRLREYNEERPHQGRWCYGKKPMATFLDSRELARDKMLGATSARSQDSSLRRSEELQGARGMHSPVVDRT